MSYPNAIEVCRAELFTKEVELRERYPGQMVEKVLRVREMYNWFIANPDGTDREFVAEVCQRHGIHRTTAYSDLAVVKSLLPMLGSASRDFHRWRTNEMLIATTRWPKSARTARRWNAPLPPTASSTALTSKTSRLSRSTKFSFSLSRLPMIRVSSASSLFPTSPRKSRL